MNTAALSRVVGCMAVLLLVPGSLTAQVIRGVVVQEGTGSPIGLAIIRALDADGQERGTVLTDSAGHYVLRLREPGTYTLRAEVIGHRTTVTGPLEVPPGTLQHTIRVPVEAIALDAVAVVARSQCRIRPDAALATQQLWEEVRKVLHAVDWHLREGRATFAISNHSRQLDRNGRPLRQTRPDTATVLDRRPFATPAPAVLARSGFIAQQPDGSFTFYAPDAEVLLSDAFLGSHCFWVTRSNAPEHDGLVGLGFEPLRTTTTSDIAGVLWVDEATAALRFVEYGYTRLPWGLSDGLASGRIDFDQLDNGAWIMRSWRIRIPQVSHAQAVRANARFVHIGFTEGGGEVRDVRGTTRTLAGAVRPAEERGEAAADTVQRAADVAPAAAAPSADEADTTAIVLDPIAVHAESRLPARLESVRDRQRRYQRLGQGHFFWREDFEQRRPTKLSDLLREIPGVELVMAEAFPGQYEVRMTRNVAIGRNECVVEIYVDGQRMGGRDGVPIDLVVPGMAHIEAVEVYKGGSQVPAEFGGTGFGCGVIVIWTR